jgi:hypothetical protein
MFLEVPNEPLHRVKGSRAHRHVRDTYVEQRICFFTDHPIVSGPAVLPRLGNDVILGWRYDWCFVACDRGSLFVSEVPDQALTGFLAADRLSDQAVVRTSVESFDTPVLTFTL